MQVTWLQDSFWCLNVNPRHSLMSEHTFASITQTDERMAPLLILDPDTSWSLCFRLHSTSVFLQNQVRSDSRSCL